MPIPHRMESTPSGPSDDELDALSRLLDENRLADADILSKSLTSRFPEHGFPWKVRGSVLQSLGQLDASLDAKKKAVERLPNDYEAHFSLAHGFHLQDKLKEAVDSYCKALELQPDNPDIYNNLAHVFKMLGHLSEAENCCRQSIALKPDRAITHNNLGNALQAQGKLAQAEESHRVALQLEPDWAEAHNNLAVNLQDQGRWEDALASYRKALAIKPDWAGAHSNLLYLLSLGVSVESKHLHAEHQAFGEQFEAPLRAHWPVHKNVKLPNRCLQVGFVSGDLFDHPVASFLEPVLKHLSSKPGFSLHAYSTNAREDATTVRLKTYFTHWHRAANLSQVELATQILAEGIDILIDLSGHTANNRLLAFAHKPAPIQVSWLGYPGTTGLKAMDYYLCEKFWIPPGQLDWQFTEKLAYLPVAVIFQKSEQSPPVNVLPALKNRHLTFGSFNRANKLNPSVIALWSMLLREIPDAKMVLGALPLDRQAEVIEHFSTQGVDLNRITFFSRTNLPEYLALHHQVDICLDTFPYGGGTTTAHALSMGVPTLTLAGETPPSRAGAMLLNQLNLNQFIAESIEDFVNKGIYWAEHIEELAEIRAKMRVRFNESALGQPERFTNSFEMALRTMWQRWCDNLPPISIDVCEIESVT